MVPPRYDRNRGPGKTSIRVTAPNQEGEVRTRSASIRRWSTRWALDGRFPMTGRTMVLDSDVWHIDVRRAYASMAATADAAEASRTGGTVSYRLGSAAAVAAA